MVPIPISDPSQCGNYRPISLLSPFGRLLESLILARIRKFQPIRKIVSQQVSNSDKMRYFGGVFQEKCFATSFLGPNFRKFDNNPNFRKFQPILKIGS